MSQIAVVVPTIRPECHKRFMEYWKELFRVHDVTVLTVWDDEVPHLHHRNIYLTPKDILGDDADLIFNKTDACRNLAFAYIARFMPEITTIITLDDDVTPIADPIKKHLSVLGKMVPISWLSTTQNEYMRGFPYGIRREAEVVVSHGVWEHVPDLDAPTQLLRPELIGGFKGPFYTGPVPKGVYIPFCGMNVAFKREALEFMYYAPMGPKAYDLGRWADIFMGVKIKDAMDVLGTAMYTGASVVRHERASNVWKNLAAEAEVLKLNETFWQGDETGHPEYFELYRSCRSRWAAFIHRHNGKSVVKVLA